MPMRKCGIFPCDASLYIPTLLTESNSLRSSAVRARPIFSICSGRFIGHNYDNSLFPSLWLNHDQTSSAAGPTLSRSRSAGGLVVVKPQARKEGIVVVVSYEPPGTNRKDGTRSDC